MKLYAGDRTIDGVQVLVDGVPLDPHYDLQRYTDNGFEWSYEGDEPRQLAFAILFDHILGDAARAMRSTRASCAKSSPISTIPGN